MRKFLCFLLLFHCVFASHLLAADDPAARPNAADIYLQVYEKLDSLPLAKRRTLWSIDGQFAAALSTEQLAAVELTADLFPLLAKAQSIEHCDWKVPFTNPWTFVQRPSLTNPRLIARLAQLRAAYLRGQGKGTQAIDALISAWAMGRRVGYGRESVAVLIQLSIDSLMAEEFASRLPSFSKAEREHLKKQLAALPAASTLKETLQRETRQVTGFFRTEFLKDVDKYTEILIETAQTNHEFMTSLDQVQGKKTKPFDRTEFEALGTLARKKPEEFKKLVDAMDSALSEHVKIYDLPPGERAAFSAKWESSLDEKNPLLHHLIRHSASSAASLAGTEYQVSVINALLQAGVGYLDEGKDALSRFKEPGTNETFVFEKTSTGFILKSRSVPFGDGVASLRFGSTDEK